MSVEFHTDIVMVDIEKIKPYGLNAKLHPKEQIEEIVRSVEEFGFNGPITIDDKYEIINGEGRYLSLKQKGATQVPCIIRDDLTDEQKHKFRLFDNKISESGYDYEILKQEIELFKEMGYDFDLTGFSEQEIDAIYNINVDFSFDTGSEMPDDIDEEVQGDIEGRNFLCEIYFPEKELAEKFLKYIGADDIEFKEGKYTKLVDGTLLEVPVED